VGPEALNAGNPIGHCLAKRRGVYCRLTGKLKRKFRFRVKPIYLPKTGSHDTQSSLYPKQCRCTIAVPGGELPGRPAQVGCCFDLRKGSWHSLTKTQFYAASWRDRPVATISSCTPRTWGRALR
jgi:hypothetical protein